MRNDKKAEEYDAILRMGDKIQRQISSLKATNAGINLSEQIVNEIAELEKQKAELQNKLQNLF